MKFLTHEFIQKQKTILEEAEGRCRNELCKVDANYCAALLQEGKIGAIRLALLRIDQQQYGLCIPCGGLIEFEILDENPESVVCQMCQMGKFRP